MVVTPLQILFIIVGLGIAGTIGLGSLMPVGKKTRPFFAGQMTTVDGALVEETVDCAILNNMQMMAPQMQAGRYGKMPNKLLVPKLTHLELEFAGGANMLDSVGDRLDITITPTHQTTHPHINDREVLFRHSIYQQLATAATNDAIGQFHLTKTFALKDAIITTSKFYLQLTLYGAAQICYYRVFYEWVEMDTNQIAMQIFNQGIINS